jgi:hypothetical protein
MHFRSLVLWAAMLAAGVTPASAIKRIAYDRGGQIGHYLHIFSVLRSAGARVVIDGDCLSACTMALGMILPENICATPRARFGFHAAWMPSADGSHVTSSIGTEALWNIYPADVRRWIDQNGGLSSKMIYLRGHDLDGIVARCDRPELRITTHSERH